MTEVENKKQFPWWKTGVIYQIYPRSFLDTTGNGVGDLQGIINKLDYLNDGTPDSLGVDAIWLSPIYPSHQVDFGYDVSDYCAIDPLFGNLDLFRELVTEVHNRGMYLILDLVLNHTSNQHPWFIEARSSRDNPRRDWYIWRDGKKGRVPNNWGSYFGGSAWQWDQCTGQYYLAMFTPEQPDLNWRNPTVKQALYEVVRFWLDQGVDGFRLDVYNQYFKDDRFRSNPRIGNPLGLVHRFWGQKHIFDRDRPELFLVLAEMRQLVDSYPERMLLGETSDEGDFLKASEYYGRSNDGLHLAYNFDFLSSKWNPAHFRAAIRKWEENLPAWGWPTYVLSNHDVSRHFSRYNRGKDGIARAKIAAAMLLTLRGTPTLYYGEEIGQADIKLTRKQILDPLGKRYWPFYKGRDGCRAPLQWTDYDQAGFSSGEPWLPVHPDYRSNNIAAQDHDPDSLLNFYRRLIWLRHRTSVLRTGTLELIDRGHQHVLAYRRQIEEMRILIILNFSAGNQVIDLLKDNPLYILVGTHRSDTAVVNDRLINLAGYEILIACEGSNHPEKNNE
ncbi:MAG: alpha-glucosidase C-terminal domain-containing protein [Candidatus Marinimicrobia bacterium]|nr:alpha-glucosidase C-terminal domain-containing protein [Candidatus Neomarinimicrobiota bacterium]